MKIIESKQTSPPEQSLYEWIKAGENTTVQCELSLAELRTLRLILGRICGSPGCTIRRWTNSIWSALHDYPLINQGMPGDKYGNPPKIFEGVDWQSGQLISRNINFDITE